MKKALKNPWVLGIGTTVVGGVILSFVIDWMNGVNRSSTLKMVVTFMGDVVVAFLNFNLKVWWVLVSITVLVLGFFLFVKIYDAKTQSTTPAFLEYKKDFISGFSWEWEYKKNYDGKYVITNLHPVCSKCGMILKWDVWEVECLRCKTTKLWDESCRHDVQMLIEDNIKNERFPKQ